MGSFSSTFRYLYVLIGLLIVSSIAFAALSVSLNNGSTTTNNPAINVTVSVSGGISHVYTVFDGQSQQQSFTKPAGTYTHSWNLIGGDGLKVVGVTGIGIASNGSTFDLGTQTSAILLDTAPPAVGSLSASINNAATYSNNAQVTLTVDGNNINSLQFSCDNVNFTSQQAFTSSKSFNLSNESGAGCNSTEGIRTVYVKGFDLSNNPLTVSDQIIFDVTPPTISITEPVNGVSYGPDNSANFALKFNLTDNVSGLNQTTYGETKLNVTPLTTQGNSKNYSSLTLTDLIVEPRSITGKNGSFRYSVNATDNAGNVSDANVTVTIDSTAPTGTLAINNGNAFTANGLVSLAVTASDNIVGTSLMRFSCNDSTFSTFTALAPLVNGFNLLDSALGCTLSEGTKNVYLQLKDGVGNVSASILDSIVYDITAPTSSISSHSNGQRTSNTSPTFTGTASDLFSGITKVEVSIDGGSFTQATGTTSWSFTPSSALSNGNHLIQTRATDGTGNLETPSAGITIQVDTTPPTNNSIVIADGNQFSNSSNPKLTLASQDALGTVTQMQFSCDGTNFSPAVNFATTYSQFNLTNGATGCNSTEGTKNVFVKFLDDLGNTSSSVSDAITFDATKPTSTITSHSNGQKINSSNLPLIVSGTASDSLSGVKKVFASKDGGITFQETTLNGSNWSISFGSSFTDGAINLVVKALDNAFNEQTVTTNLTLTLDTTAPASNSVSISKTNGFSNDVTPTLTLSSSDTTTSVAFMRFSCSQTGPYTSNFSFTTTSSQLDLSSNQFGCNSVDGLKTIFAIFEDELQNSSTAVSDSFTLDLTSPTSSISLTNDSNLNASKFPLSVSGTASDGAGAGVQLVQLSTNNEATFSNVTGTNNWNTVINSLTEGTYIFVSKATDNLGQVETPLSNKKLTVKVDLTLPTAPEPGSINLALAGTTKLNAGNFPFTLTGATSDAFTGVKEVYVSLDNAAFTLVTGTTSWSKTISLPADGSHNVRVLASDFADNNAIVVDRNFIVDTTPPTNNSISISGGANFTNAQKPSLTLASSDALGTVTQMQFSCNGTSFTSNVAFASSHSDFNILDSTVGCTSSDGNKTVFVKFTDDLGNISTAVSDGIFFDSTPGLPGISLFPPEDYNAGISFFPFTLTGTASDAGSGVKQVWVSDNNGLTFNLASGTGDWNYVINSLTEGAKEIQAKVTDNLDQNSQPSSRRITVDLTRPSSTISFPTNNAKYSSTSFFASTVSGTSSDAFTGAKKVLYSLNGAQFQNASGTTSWSIPSLTPIEGLNNLKVTGIDFADNDQLVLTDVNFVFDTIAPTGSIVVADGNAFTKNQKPSLALTASDATTSVQFMKFSCNDIAYTNNIAFATTYSDFNLLDSAFGCNSSDGNKSVFVKFLDEVGNESTAVSDEVFYDSTAPTAGISASNVDANIGVNSFPYTFAFDASDPNNGSGLLRAQLSLDNGLTFVDANNISVPIVSFIFNSITAGDHAVILRLTDNLANTADNTFTVVHVDLTPPTSTVTVPVSDANFNQFSLITFSGTAADNNVGVKKVFVSLDSGVTFRDANGSTNWSYTFNPDALQEGFYTLKVKAQDFADNNQSITTDVNYRLDFIAPTNLDLNIEGGANFTRKQKPALSLRAEDSVTGINFMQFSCNNVNYSSNVAYATTHSDFNILDPATGCTTADGNRTVYAKFTDYVGFSSTVSKNIFFDSTAPQINAVGATPPGGYGLNAFPFNYPINSSDSGSGLNKVQFKLDSGNFVDGNQVTANDWNFLVFDLSEGTHDLYVKVIDNLDNNFVEFLGGVFQVDKTRPTSIISSPLNNADLNARNFPLTVSGTAADNNSGVSKIWYSLDEGVSFNLATGTTSWNFIVSNPLTDGNHNLIIKAQDAADNNQLSLTSINVRVDSTSPTNADVNIESNALYTNKQKPSLSLNASDATTGVQFMKFSCSASGPFTSRIAFNSTHSDFNIVDPLFGCSTIDGNRTVFVAFEDLVDNNAIASETIFFDSTGANAVLVNPISDFNAGNNSFPLTVSGTASDGTGSGVQKVWVSTNNGNSFDLATGTTNWTYTLTSLTQGDYTLVVKAQDNLDLNGSTTIPQLLHVDLTNPSSVIVSPLNGAELKASNFPLTVTGTASDNNTGVQKVWIRFGSSNNFELASGTSNWNNVFTQPIDGNYSISVKSNDFADNNQSVLTDINVVVDSVAPTGTILIASGANFTNAQKPSLTLTALDVTTSVQFMKFSCNDIAYTSNIAFATTYSDFNLLDSAFGCTSSDGNKTVYVKFSDTAGNESNAFQDAIFFDSTAPSSVILSPADDSNFNASKFPLTVSGISADSTGSGVKKVFVSTNNGVTFAEATGTSVWSFIISDLSDGDYNVLVKGQDNLDQNEVPQRILIHVDKTIPTIAISSPSNDSNYTSSAFPLNVNGTSLDGFGTGVKQAWLSTDNGLTFTLATGTTSWSKSISLPADGLYQVKVKAQDFADNNSLTADLNFRVDNLPPTNADMNIANGVGYTNLSKPLLSLAALDAVTGVKFMRFSCDNLNYPANVAFASSHSDFNILDPVNGCIGGNGNKTVFVVFEDFTGNSSTQISKVVNYDTTPPTSNVSSPVSDFNAGNNSFPLTLSGTASDGTGSGVKTVWLSFDSGASFQDANGTTSWSFSKSSLTAGDYLVQVKAMDNLDQNQSSVSTVLLHVDLTPPNSVISNLANNARLSDANMPFTLTGTASDNNVGVKKVLVSTNGGISFTEATGTNSWSFSIPSLPDGNYSIKVKAQDFADNNQSVSTDVNFLFDSTPPINNLISIASGANFTNVQKPSLTLASTDALTNVASMQFSCDNVSFTSYVSFASSYSDFNMLDSTFGCNSVDGNKTIFARFADDLNNVSTAVSDGIFFDTTAPTGAFVSPVQDFNAGANALPLTLTGTASDAGSGVKQVFVSTNGGLTFPNLATGTTNWTRNLGSPVDGNYNIFIRVVDNLDQNSPSIGPLVLHIDTVVPSSTITSPLNGSDFNANEFPITISGTASDAFTGVRKVFLSTNGGTSFTDANGSNAWSFVISTPLTDGVHTLKSKANDFADNNQTSFTDVNIIVDSTPPIGASIVIQNGDNFSNDQKPDLTLTASDATTSVQFMKFSCNDIAYTNNIAFATTYSDFNMIDPAFGCSGLNGLTGIYVKFTDAVGNESASVLDSIFFDTTPPTSSVSSPVNDFNAGLNAFPLTVSGTSFDSGAGVKKVFISLDNGATFADANGSTNWSFSIASLTSGDYNIISKAQDNLDQNQVSLTTQLLHVDLVDPNTVITFPSGDLNAAQFPLTITGTASDVGTGLTKVFVSLDNGLTFADANDLSSWTFNVPTLVDGNYTLKAKARDYADNNDLTPASITLTVDKTPPTDTGISIANLLGFTNAQKPVLTLNASDGSGTGVAFMRFSCDNITFTSNIPFATSYSDFNMLDPAFGCTSGDGLKTVYAGFEDVIGNSSTAVSDSVSFDSTQPTALITSPVSDFNAGNNSFPLTVSGTASDGTGSGVQKVFVSTDNGTSFQDANGTTSWSFTLSALTQADYNLVVKAQDNLDLNGLNSSIITIHVDLNNPSASFTSPTNNVDLNASDFPLTLSGTAVDNETGIRKVQLNVDGNSFTDANGSTNWSFVVSNTLSDGNHLFRVKPVDFADNNQSNTTLNVRVDKTAPTGTSIVVADGNTFTKNQKPSLALTASDATTSVQFMKFSCNDIAYTSNIAFATTYSDFNIMDTAFGCNGINGLVGVYVKFVDAVGNTSSSVLDTVFFDSNAPTITNLIPGQDQNTSDQTPTISADFNDALSGVDLNSVQLFLDGNNVTANANVSANKVTFTSLSNLSVGSHDVNVFVSDKLGTQAVKSFSFNVVSIASHDLRTDSLSAPGTVAINSTTVVDANISNIGNVLESSNVRFFVNGVLQETVTLTNLAPGQIAIYSFNFTPTSEGVFELKVSVDSVTGEVNLSDNNKTKNVTVQATHDVRVDSIVYGKASTTTYLYNQDISVDANVFNAGNVSEDVNVQLKAFNPSTGTIIFDYNVVRIAAGQTLPMRFSWDANNKGSTILTVHAVPVTGETSTTDNSKDYSLTVWSVVDTINARFFNSSNYPPSSVTAGANFFTIAVFENFTQSQENFKSLPIQVDVNGVFNVVASESAGANANASLDVNKLSSEDYYWQMNMPNPGSYLVTVKAGANTLDQATVTRVVTVT